MAKTKFLLGVMIFLLSGCQSCIREQRAEELIAALEDQNNGLNIAGASTVVAMRNTIAEQPEVVELIALGDVAGRQAMEKFITIPIHNGDVLLSCYAYVIEKTNYRSATGTMKSFMQLGPAQYDFYWSPQFVTHTLKLLQKQSDIDTVAFVYTPEQIAAAIE